jgi:predicted HicB family RNase H-like nuclease
MRQKPRRQEPNSLARLNLRLSPMIANAVDSVCAQRTGYVSRNTWILEAIAEKLERENAANPLIIRSRSGTHG